jgi:hypothetical protein
MLNNHYEIVEGVVDNLVVFDDDVNYLANADQHSRTAGIVSVLQAAVGAPGAVHSAQAASDSGDPVEAFTMDLGGQPIQGSLWENDVQKWRLCEGHRVPGRRCVQCRCGDVSGRSRDLDATTLRTRCDRTEEVSYKKFFYICPRRVRRSRIPRQR